MPHPSDQLKSNHRDSINYFTAQFKKDSIGDKIEEGMATLKKELDSIHQDVLIKNGKYSDEQNKNVLEKFRQKIKGMMIKGDIKNMEELNKLLDRAKKDFSEEIPENDTKGQAFDEWRERVATQMSGKLHEDEKKVLENSKNVISNQLDTMTNKLKITESELTTTRKVFEEKTKDVTGERDQAIEQMNNLRNKLSHIINEKMKFESDSKSKFVEMEDKFINQLKEKEKQLVLGKQQARYMEDEFNKKLKTIQNE